MTKNSSILVKLPGPAEHLVLTINIMESLCGQAIIIKRANIGGLNMHRTSLNEEHHTQFTRNTI